MGAPAVHHSDVASFASHLAVAGRQRCAPADVCCKALPTHNPGFAGEPAAGGWRVEAVLAGSLAEAAGVRRGDLLLGIDGQRLRGLQRGEVDSLLKGPRGS